MMRYDVLALALLFVAVLSFVQHRHRATVRAQRRGIFDGCLPLFERCRVTQDDVGFPVLNGQYRGHPVRLEAINDEVVFRKLPSLWLRVTLFGHIPYEGVLDLLVRPQNTEFYSPSGHLDITVDIPPGWPQHATLRTDALERMPSLDLVQPHIAMFDDAKTKELLITPRGVRIVYQANQGTRSRYLVLRQAAFEDPAIPGDLARRLLDQALAVRRTLVSGSQQDDRQECHDRPRRPALAV